MYKSIPELIDAEMTRQGLSAYAVAKDSGVNVATVLNLRNGQQQSTNQETLSKILAVVAPGKMVVYKLERSNASD